MNRKILSLSIIVTLFILSPSLTHASIFSKLSSNELESKDSCDWTLMFYFAADNKIESQSLDLIDDLIALGSDGNLSIIYLFDGLGKQDTELCYINNENEAIDIGKGLGWPDEVNTGDKNTLNLFCEQVMENYPANHYALHVVTVGAGWQGFSPDFQNYPDSSMISIKDFSEILKDITNDGENKIDVLSIVGCLMNMIEVSTEIEPYVDYYVASEADNANLQIWPNIEAVSNLKNNTSTSSEVYVNKIIGEFKPGDIPLSDRFLRKIFDLLPFSKFNFVTIHTCISVINLSKIPVLNDEINDLASLLILNQDDKDMEDAISSARKNVREYGRWSPKYHILYRPMICPLYDILPIEIFAFDCYIDLYHLADLLNEKSTNAGIKEACEQVKIIINETVFFNNFTESDPNSHGLSIYFPDSRKFYDHSLYPIELPCPYKDLTFSQNTKWNDFLESNLNIQ